MPIDLYQVRCAVAALVDCVGHHGLLSTASLRRTDLAVKILSSLRAPETSALRRAVDRLLSPTEDPTGSRTVDAIVELATLTHVDAAAAPALAAALLLPVLPRPQQGLLFDGDHEPDPAPPAHLPPGLDAQDMTPDRTEEPR